MAQQARSPARPLRVAVAGNPNAGKSTLFNRLTGLRQKVGNYPGVTVDRKVGACVIDGVPVELVDLPGAQSLSPQSPDEAIARDQLFGWLGADDPAPDVVLVVVDATNLQRNLFLATQILELGYPAVMALNMIDVAEGQGLAIDHQRLSRELGVPVVTTVGSKGLGLETLRAALLEAARSTSAVPLVEPLRRQVEVLSERLTAHTVPEPLRRPLALRLIASPDGLEAARTHYGDDLADAVEAARAALAEDGLPWPGAEATSRYEWLRGVVDRAIHRTVEAPALTLTDRVDRVLTHRFWGPVFFFLAMAFVFQTIYSWATPLMDLIDAGTVWLGEIVTGWLPAGVLCDLLVDGVITGVGAVVIFLPQILLLFLFLSLLEDSGYMARAAFVMDRLMSRVGLHGRSFVPLLSSFACAVPGIMATRTISNPKDRITTILVAPLITCAARLPVYALLIAAFVPQQTWLGGLVSSQGLALLGLYLLGIGGALGVAAVLKRTLLRAPTPALLLDLPPYRRPSVRQLAHDLGERAWVFLRFAGSVILSLSIVLWFLAYFPRAELGDVTPAAVALVTADGGDPSDPEQLAAAVSRVEGEAQLEQSFIGRLGRGLEPLVRPLGYDWRIGVGLVSAFAAREVLVSTFGVLFAVGEEVSETDQTLISRLRRAQWPDGRPLFPPATVASLLIFFVFACQCLSTVGVVVRETGGWRWAWFLLGYTWLLAYFAALATYQGLRLAGWG